MVLGGDVLYTHPYQPPWQAHGTSMLYGSYFFADPNSATWSTTANTVFYAPIYVGPEVTVYSIQSGVLQGSPGATARLGIYTMAGGKPYAKMFETASLNGSAVAQIGEILATNVVLTTGFYFVAIVADQPDVTVLQFRGCNDFVKNAAHYGATAISASSTLGFTEATTGIVLPDVATPVASVASSFPTVLLAAV